MTDTTAPDPLLATLRAAWGQWDPPPADLAETILVAIAMEDFDTDYELLSLVNRHDHLAGTRTGASDAGRVLIEFRSATLSVLVRVSAEGARHQRLDGWVTPAGGGSVTVVQGDTATTTPLDAHGRFEVPVTGRGLTRLVVQPDPGPDTTPHPDADSPEFRTTLFEI